MTNTQYIKFRMWLSFDNKIKDIEDYINKMDNKCDGNSNEIGYNIDTVICMKKDLNEILTKYKNISQKAKEEI